jgi:peptidoglycan/LPS O-acetylase OafA/YrhL
VNGTAASNRLAWVDALKGVAILWVITNHFVERIFGSEYFGNPSATWPPLGDRLAQLAPIHGGGGWNALVNAVRYGGWTGDTGVGVFLLASGFGLTYALLRAAPATLDVLDFYRRRAGRIYPLWWCAHLFFALTWLLTGWGIAFTHKGMYLSMLGVRFTPGLFDFFSSSWWFIGLLIQLYLVFPLLWKALREYGPLRLLVISCALGFAARLAGLIFLRDYMPEWERGAIFVTRLPEFVAGMSLAAYWFAHQDAVDGWMRSPRTAVFGVLAFTAGMAASFTLLGNVVSPLLMTVGSVAVIYSAIVRSPALAVEGASWLGKHSYSLYLTNQPIIVLLVPAGFAAAGIGLGADIAVALALMVTLALVLEAVADRGVALLARWQQAFGLPGTALRVAAAAAGFIAILASAELIVERFWPQEVYGWGERPSLQPDGRFGWRLTPDATTRLRWMGYDYTVVANQLGFPGPSYAPDPPPGSIRIMTLGDAFTSAEGVDTAASWPRLLENKLDAKYGAHRVQVLNFAITGYGPAQFEAVAREFVPRFKPNLVIIGFFVKDYGDVLRSDTSRRAAIGFDLHPLPAWKRVLLMYHARRLVQINFVEPLSEFVTGVPRAQGYALGNLVYFERNRTDLTRTAPPLVERRLSAIRAVDREAGAQTVILMIPASVQVCPPRDLPYYPVTLDLGNAARFDLDLPQRETRAIARRLHVPAYDLRPVLTKLRECPYQPWNMHWTPAGQLAAAEFLSARLTDDHLLVQPLAGSSNGGNS